jgi:hypothetical protein
MKNRLFSSDANFSLRKSEFVAPCAICGATWPNAAKPNGGKRSAKGIFCPRGRRNLLKRLKTAKRIQGNPSFFLCFPLPALGRASLDFEEFGIGLESRIKT